jgi:tagatose-6-phosphate ketose/aldose isomerase
MKVLKIYLLSFNKSAVMSLLNLSTKYLTEKGAMLTATEIAGQPFLWEKTARVFSDKKNDLQKFLAIVLTQSDNIILTGAGTSAYIGLSLHGCFLRKTGKLTRAVATTDAVSFPQDFFNDGQTPLIISFARSGNSPESCAALELADKFSKKCFHLIITCDANGALANYKSVNETFVFVLPEDANDKSLAMTGSYSSMLLAGLFTAYINETDFYTQQLKMLLDSSNFILNKQLTLLQGLAEKDFQRAVFLGSGPLAGTATEAALKLQELTDGEIICKNESFLGFRHGPKAVINENTLVVYFFSNNLHVQQYEKDLVKAMKNGSNALFQLGISEELVTVEGMDAQINFGINGKKLHEDFLAVCSILPGQLIGFYKSLQSGYMPDSPSVSGSISRVVQGVNIYPVATP